MMIKVPPIQDKIYKIRGMRVMLDYDLAALYETETKQLKQAVRRNLDRFPSDFMFEITKEEYQFLRSQFVTLETGRGSHSKYLPFAFTEQGVAMLSSVVNNPKAVQMNIAIMRAFVVIREIALNYSELTKRLKELETKFDGKFSDVYQAISYLLDNDKKQEDQSQRKRIGFKNKQTA